MGGALAVGPIPRPVTIPSKCGHFSHPDERAAVTAHHGLVPLVRTPGWSKTVTIPSKSGHFGPPDERAAVTAHQTVGGFPDLATLTIRAVLGECKFQWINRVEGPKMKKLEFWYDRHIIRELSIRRERLSRFQDDLVIKRVDKTG